MLNKKGKREIAAITVLMVCQDVMELLARKVHQVKLFEWLLKWEWKNKFADLNDVNISNVGLKGADGPQGPPGQAGLPGPQGTKGR